MIQVMALNQDEFERNKSKILFYDKKIDIKHGLVKSNFITFKIGWHSDLINPRIYNITKDIYCVGIDRHFAIANFEIGNIYFHIDLDFFFSEVRFYKNCIFIITEMEIIILDYNFMLLQKFSLPDIYSSCSFINDALLVLCLNGKEYKFNLPHQTKE